jgi:hypothetical protein
MIISVTISFSFCDIHPLQKASGEEAGVLKGIISSVGVLLTTQEVMIVCVITFWIFAIYILVFCISAWSYLLVCLENK